MSKREARSFENLTPEQQGAYESQDLANQLGSSGFNNAGLVEPVPLYDSAPSEKVIKNSNNAWIVLGRDRPGGVESGYGGLGNTAAGSIDIVVGRMAGADGGPDGNLTVGPNFFTDAARIHISQRTDIDTNFGLCGNAQAVTRSGIGIKADAVRVVGREGVKIVTGKAKNVSGAGSGGERNSQGGEIQTVAGIELIAGNDTGSEELEPLVKAYALNEALEEIAQSIKDLNNIVNELAKTQTQINRSIATHTHMVPVGPAMSNSTPSVDLAVTIATKEASRMSNVHQNISKHKNNIGVAFTSDYLSPTGDKWFGSRFNKTN
tara:strand:+ start:27083 stop:28042 length:960 start_codon:yes stop_codon:yes gene_type:complete